LYTFNSQLQSFAIYKAEMQRNWHKHHYKNMK